MQNKVEVQLSVPQSKVLMCKSRFITVCAGRRFGKSYVAGTRIMQAALSERANKRGDYNILYVAPVAEQARKIMWTGWLRKHLPQEYIASKNNQTMDVLLKNGCSISVRSADDPDHLVGDGIDLLVIDECALIKTNIYEILRPSLSDKHHDGKALFISTPRGFNWFYKLFRKGGQEDGWTSFLFTSIDGGNIEASEIEQAKKDLTPRMFAQEYLASFETMTNLVYDSYNKTANTCDIQSYWGHSDIHVGMDFNVNPMTATVAVLERDKRLNGETVAYVFDEILLPNANTYEMAREIRQRYPVADVYVYPDPTGKKRQTSAVAGITDFSILEQAGFKVLAPFAPYKVRDKVNIVNTAMANASGEHRVYIANGTCPKLREALEGYTYKENGDFDKSTGYDHITDALAYFLCYRFPMLSNSGWYKPEVYGV